MKISGRNQDIKSFLKDIPVSPGEKMKEFTTTFKDCPALRDVAKLLYNVEVTFTEKEIIN